MYYDWTLYINECGNKTQCHQTIGKFKKISGFSKVLLKSAGLPKIYLTLPKRKRDFSSIILNGASLPYLSINDPIIEVENETKPWSTKPPITASKKNSHGQDFHTSNLCFPGLNQPIDFYNLKREINGKEQPLSSELFQKKSMASLLLQFKLCVMLYLYASSKKWAQIDLP